MALSFVEYEGDGTATNFAIPFPYISRTHVSAIIDDVPFLGLVFISDSLVTISPAPIVGADIKIKRTTPVDDLLTIFTGTEAIPPRRLNQALRQLLYVVQEAYDSALTLQDATSELLALYQQIVDLTAQVQLLLAELQELYDDIEDVAANAFWRWSLPIFVPYTPFDSEVVAAVAITKELELPADFAGSKAFISENSPATLVFPVTKVAVLDGAVTAIGTVTFTSGSKNAVFGTSAATLFAEGDRIVLTAPTGVLHSAFHHFGLTFEFERTDI